MNDDILAIINRPSVPWEEQKKLVKKFSEIMPPGKKNNIMAELILGLPGQTPERVSEMILELYRNDVRQWQMENWAYLENSPAAEKEYINRFNLKWGDVIYPPRNGYEFEDLDQLFKDLTEDKFDPNDWTRFTIITQNNTMDLIDIMQTSIFLKRFSKICKSLPIKSVGEASFKILDNIRKDILIEARKQVIASLKIQEPYAKKYGFYIYGIITDKKITSMWQMEI